MREIFQRIYRENIWGNAASRSGDGSDLDQTRKLLAELPSLLRDIGATSLLDLPCGDFHWMQRIALDLDYTGGDIVPDLIMENERAFGGPRRRFMVLDATSDALPRVDVVLCRDMLVHLSFADIGRAMGNIRRSGSVWLLATTFVDRNENVDIETGQWRPLNMERAPFGWPRPACVINEDCTEWDGHWRDKSLGLWKLSELPQ